MMPTYKIGVYVREAETRELITEEDIAVVKNLDIAHTISDHIRRMTSGSPRLLALLEEDNAFFYYYEYYITYYRFSINNRW